MTSTSAFFGAPAVPKPHVYRFADPAAAKLAPGERGVRLRFAGGVESSGGGDAEGADGGEAAPVAVELFAHPFVLRSCSGVLAALLESCGGDGNPEESGGGGSAVPAGGGDAHLTVPLDGDDPLAWDDALSVMHGAAMDTNRMSS